MWVCNTSQQTCCPQQIRMLLLSIPLFYYNYIWHHKLWFSRELLVLVFFRILPLTSNKRRLVTSFAPFLRYYVMHFSHFLFHLLLFVLWIFMSHKWHSSPKYSRRLLMRLSFKLILWKELIKLSSWLKIKSLFLFVWLKVNFKHLCHSSTDW